MHSYTSMRGKHGNAVSQTIDSPIMIFDYWELGDAFAAIGVVLVFGVLFYEWGLMMALLLLVLGIGPAIRRRNEKGIFLHWPYRKLGVSLPGLINPRGGRTYSD
ncbi:MAG: hypothetical protein AB7T49_20210 [Oligoflexales bacterium]